MGACCSCQKAVTTDESTPISLPRLQIPKEDTSHRSNYLYIVHKYDTSNSNTPTSSNSLTPLSQLQSSRIMDVVNVMDMDLYRQSVCSRRHPLYGTSNSPRMIRTKPINAYFTS